MRHRRGLTLGVFLATVLCVRLTAWAGLLGYWAFDDPGNPNTALDVSGAGNHGSVVGATYSGDGGGHTGNSGDTAMNFGTSNNGARVSLPTAASGAFTSTGANNAATISLWIHGDSTQPQEDAAFNFSEPGGPGDPRRLMSHIPWSNQNIYWDVGGCCGATFRINKAENDPSKWEGEWNHYVFVKDGTTGQSSRIYQNGALWHSGATSAIIGNITAAVIGASDTNGGSSYGGLIDDFAIWDQALTADQIQNLYDKTKTPLNVLIDGDLTSQQNGYWDQAGTWVGTMVGVPTANTAVTVDSNLVTCRQTTDVGGSLDVVGTGQVTIQSGKKLTLSWRLDVAPGASMTLGDGGTDAATLVVGEGGSISSLTTNGNATIDTGRALAISGSTFDAQGATGTFTKLGAGTLSLDNGTGTGVVGTANTTFEVAAGTLESVGAAPLGASSSLVLSGGTASFGDYLSPPGPAPAGAQAYYSFDAQGNPGNDDSGGGAHGTLNSPTWVADGRSGGALDFDGNDYVNAVVNASETAYAVALWFKADADNRGIFSVHDPDPIGGTVDRLIWLAGGEAAARTWGPTFNEIITTSGMSLADGAWHQVVHTFGGTEGGQKIYIDGALAASGTRADSEFDWQTSITIGFANDAANDWFDGLIDEVYLYNRALTAAEAAAMAGTRASPDMSTTDVRVTANSALVSTSSSPLPFRDLTLENGSILTTSGSPMGFRSTTLTSGSGGFDNANDLDVGTYDDGGADKAFLKRGSGTLVLDNTTPGSIVAGHTDFRVEGGTLKGTGATPLGNARSVTLAGATLTLDTGGLPPGLVAYYNFDGGTASDGSGHGYDGTFGGNAHAAGGALILDGSGDYVQAPNMGAEFTNSASMAVWVKLNNATPTDGTRTGFFDFDNGFNSHYPWTSGLMYSGLFRTNNERFDAIALSGTIDREEWHLLTVVSDPTEGYKIYQNDQQIFSAAQPPFGMANWQIGTQNGAWLDGQLDNFLLLNRGLTAADVAALYANGRVALGNPLNVGTHITVEASSTLEAIASSAAFGQLTLKQGTLTARGAAGGMSFTGGGLDAATTSAGIDNPMDVTINGPWDGQGAAASFTKTGAGRLTFTQGTTNHGGVAVQVQEGRLASDGPMQAASLTIVSGANVDTGLNDVAIGDGGQFRAGNLTIGSTGAPFAVGGDNMAAGPQRLTITGGTVTLRANVGASGLIAYWPFEQGSGTTAYDRSAGVHDGSIIGAAWVNDPERGWVLDFDGPDSVNVPAAGAAFSPIATTQKVSISVWQYGDPAVQPQSDTLFQGTDGGRQLSVHIPWGDRNVYWDAFGDWDRINQAASDSEFEGQWNHWVFTKDQATGTMEIYLNGAPWLSGTGKTRTFTNITSFRIGATSSGGENYDGMIDDFAVFDRVLTDTEIQAIYAGTFFRNDPINLPQTDLTVLDDATLVLDTDQSVVLGDVAMYLDTLLTIESDATSITFDTLDLLGEMHNGTYTLMELLDSEGDPRYGVFGPGMFTDVLVNGNPAGYVTLSYPEGHLVEIKVVPEPGTLTLLGLGGIGLVIRRRRNRKPR